MKKLTNLARIFRKLMRTGLQQLHIKINMNLSNGIQRELEIISKVYTTITWKIKRR